MSEDSGAGAVDSVVVTEHLLDTEGDSYSGKGLDFYREYLIIKWLSYFTIQNGQYSTYALCAPPHPGDACYLSMKSITGLAGESWAVEIGNYYFKTGYYPGSDAYATHVYDHYTVDSTTYQNVVRTRIPDDYTLGGDTSYYYFGKDAGLIRWEDKAPSGNWWIWKLKRYHAVR